MVRFTPSSDESWQISDERGHPESSTLLKLVLVRNRLLMAVCGQQDAGATEEEKALKEFLDDVSDPEEAASSSDEEAPQVRPLGSVFYA